MLPAPLQQLSELLTRELPGRQAQLRMAHAGRVLAQTAIRSDVRPAAVMILLYPGENGWHTVLIQRKRIVGDRHSGQISFPGGRQEPGEMLFETAVRECFEEIDAPPDGIHRVGALSELHIPVSNYLVYPFVGYHPEPGPFAPEVSEVERILEVPMTTLLDPATQKRAKIRLATGLVLDDVPCFMVQGHIVWGATAMIMRELLDVLQGDSGVIAALL